MALIKCSECQNEISDQAVMCPKCGNKNVGNNNQNIGNNTQNVVKNRNSSKTKLDTVHIVLLIVDAVLFLVAILVIVFSSFSGSYTVDDTFEYYEYESGTYGYTIRYTLDLDSNGTCTHRLYSYFPYFSSRLDNTYDCSYSINKADETITVTYDDGSSDDYGYVYFDGSDIDYIIFEDDMDQVYYNKY